jgi:membrane protease YdiL (CAAX protease family)
MVDSPLPRNETGLEDEAMSGSEEAGANLQFRNDSPGLAAAARAPENTRRLKAWRDSNWLALVEFLVVGLIFYADHRRWIPISKTPELVLVGWISLRVRRLRWRDVGLTRCLHWPRTVGIGVALGALLEIFQLLVTQPILARLLGRQPDLEFFRTLTGNWRMTVLFIALSWTLAAFGEEVVWRGYLMNRAADVFGSSKSAWAASLVVVSAVFGLAHGYQGMTGWIEEAIAGLALGVMYLGTGKNLWVPVLVHGVSNTIDMVLIFFGKMPGL